MLEYAPAERVSPLVACTHPFFDELREQATRLPSGAPLPADLLEFTETELSISPSLNEKLVPEWKRSQLSSRK
jgi:acyl-CoA hydrolase